MTSTALVDRRARQQMLRQIVGGDRRRLVATALLIGDTVAGVGFAAGLASAVAAIAGDEAWLGWAVLALIAGIARGTFAMHAQQVGASLAADAKTRLRRRVTAAAVSQPLAGTRSSGEIATSIVDEVEALDGYVARFSPIRTAAGLSPLIVLCAVALLSLVAALILVGTLVPLVAALILAGTAAADRSRQQFAATARLSGLFADRLRALPLLLAFQATGREGETLSWAADDVASRTMRVLKVAFLSTGALEFFAALSVALVAVYAGFNVLRLLPFTPPEQLDLFSAFFVLALAPEFYLPLRRLAAAYHDKQAAETAADRIVALERDARPSALRPLAEPPRVSFDEVTLRYDGSDMDAIAAVSFSVEPGESIALMGASGSGKSSILGALVGLVPRREGALAIDGHVLDNGTSLAGAVAWVGQAPLIVPGTLADNIRLARPDASRAEIAEAASAAGLSAVIASRPGGLDAVIGARAGGLSGGERRRMGLARALLSRAPLLLLDEPTAHLDDDAEAELIPVIARACRGRTAIIATHSAALTCVADRVIRLEDRA